ncbi:unnamed protein product [Leuciscus chuanchicus]
MLDVLLLFSSICTAVVVGASQTITGYRGERVEIRCSYKSGYESYSKYFCKGEWNSGYKNIMVKSGSPAKDERFSLTDDTTARVFTVTITDLRTEDGDQYWCGVERTGPDLYSEMLLLVKLNKNTTEVSTISPSSKTPSSFSPTELNPQSVHVLQQKQTSSRTLVGEHNTINLASVAGGLGSVLLVLTLCSGTFIILKKRKRKSGTAPPMRLIYVGSPKKSVIRDRPLRMCGTARSFRPSHLSVSILWVQRQGDVWWTRLHKRRISTTCLS